MHKNVVLVCVGGTCSPQNHNCFATTSGHILPVHHLLLTLTHTNTPCICLSLSHLPGPSFTILPHLFPLHSSFCLSLWGGAGSMRQDESITLFLFCCLKTEVM